MQGGISRRLVRCPWRVPSLVNSRVVLGELLKVTDGLDSPILVGPRLPGIVIRIASRP